MFVHKVFQELPITDRLRPAPAEELCAEAKVRGVGLLHPHPEAAQHEGGDTPSRASYNEVKELTGASGFIGRARIEHELVEDEEGGEGAAAASAVKREDSDRDCV